MPEAEYTSGVVTELVASGVVPLVVVLGGIGTWGGAPAFRNTPETM